MKAKLVFLAALFLAFHSNAFGAPPTGGVELHSHLWMKQGLTWFFRGDFNDPLHATSWKDRFSSQVNPQSLDKSQLDIVVAFLYAHPLLTQSLKKSIREQLAAANRFVTEHPKWIIARSPQEAGAALAQGKRVLILALEGASGILEKEEDLVEFIDQGGIRIVTLLHLTDDSLGGVAFLKGLRALASPFAFMRTLFQPLRDPEGTRLNPKGLTEEGEKLAKALIRRRVWIDLAHSSDAAFEQLYPLLHQANQPPLYTHTVLRKYLKAERAISSLQLQIVAGERGFLGLMPCEEMLEGTPPTGQCAGGVHALATQFREITQILGESSVALGSDFNGGITHLKPSCHTGTELDRNGFWNIGQSQEVWRALKALGVWNSEHGQKQVTRKFLETWSRLWQPKTAFALNP